ncbi:MAG: immunoglobulin domain-containing protein [Verrucomicrobia bacterium]|nr:immunoglobulin domain-containing protein [Verrucomicrobiota bacterium]
MKTRRHPIVLDLPAGEGERSNKTKSLQQVQRLHPHLNPLPPGRGKGPNPVGIHYAVILLTFLLQFSAFAQTLNLPPRPADAPTGTAFAQSLIPLAGPSSSNNRNISAREAAICGQILQGNIPSWMRQLTLITTNGIVNGTNHTVSYYVTRDYLAIGSDTDYFLTPMTPLLGQYLANKLNCTMPTSKMVNHIWTAAPCKLAPSPIPWGPEMVTVPVFIDHNNTVRGQRFAVTNTHPLGTLVGGDKKDVIISGRIYTAFANASITKPVVIYGWHQLNGTPIQGVYNGHEETYADYSHGVRLVQMGIIFNGQPNTVTNILTNPNLAGVISNDPYYTSNTIPTPRYPTFNSTAPIITTPPAAQTVTPDSTVTFRAFAIGDGQLTYQWRWNGTNILNATNTTLTLINVQTNQAGNYSVAVSSSLGSANATAVLSVVPATPVQFETITKTTNGVELTLSGASGESYVVQASTNLISWKPISVLAITNGPLPFVDLEAIHLASRYYKAGHGSTSWLNNFESAAIGSGNTFLNPISSGSTISFLNTNAPTYAYVTNNLPSGNTSSKALAVGWTFTGVTNAWLRLTTFNAPQLPNPTIAFNQALLFDIYTSNSLHVAVGVRETGTSAEIGANGGDTGSIEWIGTTTTTPPRGRLVPAGEWTTLQFFIPHESVRAFTGDGILSSATGKGVLEHLAFTPVSGTTEHRVLLDNFRVIDLVP